MVAVCFLDIWQIIYNLCDPLKFLSMVSSFGHHFLSVTSIVAVSARLAWKFILWHLSSVLSSLMDHERH